MQDWSSRFVGFFGIKREVQGPVVEVVGVGEGLVYRETVLGEVGVAGFGIEAKTILEIRRGLGKLLP